MTLGGSDADTYLAVLPGMGGRELADQFLRERPGTPVLYISGYTDDVVLQQGLTEPGAAFLAKPFSPKALSRQVRDLLDSAAPGNLAQVAVEPAP